MKSKETMLKLTLNQIKLAIFVLGLFIYTIGFVTAWYVGKPIEGQVIELCRK